jgi:hypothetical protein
MAALDAEVVDLLGKIQNGVAFDAKVEKGVKPLASGVEMNDRAFEFAFAEPGVPRAHAGALKAGPKHHVVLAEPVNMCRGKIRAAPV